mmetsp:Transcript_38304/g.57000  ORF Transcript_38304/g.57000 Transcript_38304/m.57000 type:complete len:349 (-) Transcript_38304:381-1427(-)|eukprot:CAMPEP_0194029744 /NCGR_PEP_ID=MMETSP0009_2-20130614/3406_1 /TAXON_ID=210454 /ORGANISM="Grammatophora oceanica, Strain CCMP 410" /LENGTH=348 /DNA_ID=CAMNT_0038669511 /DNA_START=107 /DNA_END=1153 /DNA_ORIENTATION=+
MSASTTVSNVATKLITSLNDHDVLLGRTKECFNWTGNKHFRQYISQAVGRYLEAPTRADKSVVVNSLMFGIQELGGRFLKRCGPQGWVEVEDKHARDKCSHAVRDAANTMAKRGCLEGEQAAKAAQVSTRLARVLSDTGPKKRQSKASVAKSKTMSSNNLVTPATVTSAPLSTPEVPTSSDAASAHTHPHNTRNKGIVRSVSIVSDSDGSTDSPYSSDDESVTSLTASMESAANAPKSDLIKNKARVLSHSKPLALAPSTDCLEPLHISTVTPPATPAHNMAQTASSFPQNDFLLTQALMAVGDDAALLIPDATDDDKCWFEPSDFQLLPELPLDDDWIMQDLEGIQI